MPKKSVLLKILDGDVGLHKIKNILEGMHDNKRRKYIVQAVAVEAFRFFVAIVICIAVYLMFLRRV